MPIEVKMAKLSPTMESGQMVKWLVKVGDKVKEGDTLAEVQTDKAVMSMESFEEGTVALLDVAEGDDIDIGQRVLVLAQKGEDPKAVGESLGGKTAAPALKDPAAKAPAEAPAPEPEPEPDTRPEAQRADASYREETNVPQTPERGTNGQGDHDEASAEPYAGGRIKSSPLARKVAKASGVELHRVTPSGPGGRVVRSDVEEYLRAKPNAAQAAPAKATTKGPAAAPKAPGAVERIPLTRMRATIAQRMAEAKKQAPEIHVTVDIRVDQVVAIRERLNKQLAAEKIKLSVGDVVTKAVALALRQHPAMNATFEDNTILRHSDVNVGLAVALDGGLIVPVLRNADTLGLREIRTGSEVLYDAARSLKLTGEQLSGGTFTISNLGMYGVREFDAILNLPQVGILAVGAAEKRPVVVGDALAVGTVMSVTLTADHRAVDGAAAAEFLRTLKGLLEEPAMMLL